MHWNQPFSRWAQRLMLGFGILNLGAAAVAGPTAWVPGLVIGGMWTLAGWRGYPLIPSTDVRTIRIRRRFAMGMPFSVIFFVPLVLIATEGYRMAAMVVISIPSIVALFLFAFSACPRCQQHFSLVGAHSQWTKQCVHCGLSLNSPKAT